MQRLKNSALLGLRVGFKTWWWIARMTLAATLFVALLQWSGGIAYISEWLTPFFQLFGLSTEAALVFISTALSNIYAGVGVMATLAINYREATLLAVMGLICHNIIIETIIQKRSGANTLFIVVLRIGMALLAAAVLNQLLPEDYTGSLVMEHAASIDNLTFVETIKAWAMNMATMMPIMMCMICGLNMMQQILQEFNIIQQLSKPLVPLMAIFGLKRDSALMWLVLYTLGLAYGGSIMIAERDSGALTLRESKLLNTHIALSHSLLEDTLLYLAIGLSFFWLVVPRLILAIIAVWTQRLYFRYGYNRTNQRATN